MTAKDLSDRVPGLVVSSMSAGNTVADSPGVSLTAPGTPSVNSSVFPDKLDRIPLPADAIDKPLSVLVGADGRKPDQPDELAPDQHDAAGGWRDAGGYEPDAPWWVRC